MGTLTNQFEIVFEKIKNDPSIGILALAINDTINKQKEQENINSLVRNLLEKHTEQIDKLAESMMSLSQGMMIIAEAIQNVQSNKQGFSYPFKGIEIK